MTQYTEACLNFAAKIEGLTHKTHKTGGSFTDAGVLTACQHAVKPGYPKDYYYTGPPANPAGCAPPSQIVVA